MPPLIVSPPARQPQQQTCTVYVSESRGRFCCIPEVRATYVGERRHGKVSPGQFCDDMMCATSYPESPPVRLG